MTKTVPEIVSLTPSSRGCRFEHKVLDRAALNSFHTRAVEALDTTSLDVSWPTQPAISQSVSGMKLLRARSRSELETLLATLDPPSGERFRRVYRGQPRRHFLDNSTNIDSLLPRLLRSKVEADPMWIGAVKRLSTYLKSKAAQGSLLPLSQGLSQVVAAALLQHYGSGSAFLDVTGDLSVALWFATHQWCEDRSTHRIYPDGHELLHVKLTAAWFEPVAKNPGVLYVFDVRPWLPSWVLEHGHLIELLDPLFGLGDVLGDDNRLVRQKASLLSSVHLSGFAGTTNNAMTTATLNSILHPFLRGESSEDNLFDQCVAIVELEPGFVYDGPGTLELFPTPEQDRVYRTLLKAPCTPVDVIIGKTGHRVDNLEKSIDVPEYYSQKPPLIEPVKEDNWPDYYEQLKSYSDCDQWPRPVFFLADLREQTAEFQRVELNSKPFLLQETMRIWLRSAHWWMIPNPLSPHWNHAALARAPLTLGDLELSNICVELSALDLWDPDLTPSKGAVRAVWIVRDADQYLATIFRVDQGQGTWRYVVPIAFDSSCQKFKILEGDSTERLILEALHGLFLVLDLICHMMPNRTFTIEIAVQNGTPIVNTRRCMPIELHKWGEYFIPYFKNGTAFCPGLEFFEDNQEQLEESILQLRSPSN